jgi:hypothetical protein
MLLLQIAQSLLHMDVLHTTQAVVQPVIASVVHVLGPIHPLATPPAGATAPPAPTSHGSAYNDIVGFANSIQSLVQVIGGVIFIISISIAAMMRMMTFGGQQRIMFSNMALTGAVVGLIILTMAGVLAKLVSQAFH